MLLTQHTGCLTESFTGSRLKYCRRLCYYVITSHPVYIDYELDDGTIAGIVVIDTGLVSGNTNPDGNPIDREAADAALFIHCRALSNCRRARPQFVLIVLDEQYIQTNFGNFWKQSGQTSSKIYSPQCTYTVYDYFISLSCMKKRMFLIP